MSSPAVLGYRARLEAILSILFPPGQSSRSLALLRALPTLATVMILCGLGDALRRAIGNITYSLGSWAIRALWERLTARPLVRKLIDESQTLVEDAIAEWAKVKAKATTTVAVLDNLLPTLGLKYMCEAEFDSSLDKHLTRCKGFDQTYRDIMQENGPLVRCVKFSEMIQPLKRLKDQCLECHAIIFNSSYVIYQRIIEYRRDGEAVSQNESGPGDVAQTASPHLLYTLVIYAPAAMLFNTAVMLLT